MMVRKNLWSIAVTLFVSLGLGTASHAVVVDASVGRYDVQLLTSDSFNDLLDTLDDQVWWGSTSLAREFSELVGEDLGIANPGFLDFGPVFATGSNSLSNAVGCYYSFNRSQVSCNPWGPVSSDYVYAYATPISAVPVPASLPLMLTALGLAGFLSRRRRS